MIIFILEDDDERIKFFKQKFAEHTVRITKDTQDAIQMLEEMEHHYIFLDHDLSDEHYKNQDAIEKTGEDVSKYLGRNPHINKDAEIIIHSYNFEGAKRMASHLKDRENKVHLIPFAEVIMRMQVV